MDIDLVIDSGPDLVPDLIPDSAVDLAPDLVVDSATDLVPDLVVDSVPSLIYFAAYFSHASICDRTWSQTWPWTLT
jgi:hypothetical protein